MSDNVMSTGLMAIVKSLPENVDRDELSEYLYDNTNGELSINYEGTLVYTDNGGDAYGISFGIATNHDSERLIQLCDEHNIEIDVFSIRPYSCYWYNGCDSDMDMLKIDSFKAMTKQT